MIKILVLHGPNLRLLGTREPEIYGHDSLESINRMLRDCASRLSAEVAFFQSDIEGELVSRIGSAPAEGFDGIVMNPAAYTHTSIALLDALRAAALPAVEVHLSNIATREEFRRVSMTAAGCIGIVAGFGTNSYRLALEALAAYLQCKKPLDGSGCRPGTKENPL